MAYLISPWLIETVTYRIIIRGIESTPVPAASIIASKININLSSFPLNLRCFTLRENIGIRVTINTEKHIVKKLSTHLEE